MPMTIQSGAISRSRRKWVPVIDRCASGGPAGSPAERSPTHPDLGHRGVFPPEVRAQVTAAACSLPCQCSVPLARWSRAELARYIAARLEKAHPSISTIGRWLKVERIRPWRYHCWQHIQDPERFLERACPVLRRYEQARALLSKGIWLV